MDGSVKTVNGKRFIKFKRTVPSPPPTRVPTKAAPVVVKPKTGVQSDPSVQKNNNNRLAQRKNTTNRKPPTNKRNESLISALPPIICEKLFDKRPLAENTNNCPQVTNRKATTKYISKINADVLLNNTCSDRNNGDRDPLDITEIDSMDLLEEIKQEPVDWELKQEQPDSEISTGTNVQEPFNFDINRVMIKSEFYDSNFASVEAGVQGSESHSMTTVKTEVVPGLEAKVEIEENDMILPDLTE